MDRALAARRMAAEGQTVARLVAAASAAVHDLMRLDDLDALIFDTPPPAWVEAWLRRAPWVVVRRARPRAGFVAVGIRGATRSERCAAWLARGMVVAAVTPEQLAQGRTWSASPRLDEIAALYTLDAVATACDRLGLEWGPVGSVGFELASGVATATAISDLDVVMRAPRPQSRQALIACHAVFASMPCRVDVQLETPFGAVALAEYIADRGSLLVRTPDGARLTDDPWLPVSRGSAG